MTQHMDALAFANEVRLAQADFKRQFKGMAYVDAAPIMADAILHAADDSPVGKMRVRVLLVTLPRVGDAMVRRMEVDAGVRNSDRRLRELTPRQRQALADVIRNRWVSQRAA
jgi:hypothetical protein